MVEETEDYGWPLENSREFASEFYTEEELTEKCQENGWVKRWGYIFQEDPFMEADYEYSYYVCKTVEELKSAFLYGNWSIRQGFVYRSLAFINQVNAGDEWWTLKKFPDEILAFESCTMIAIINHGEFEDYIAQMLKATKEQCRKLEYLDEAFLSKYRRGKHE